MSPVSLIPALQSDALVREIEQQLADENGTVAEGAQRDAHGILAQARASACRQVHEAIEKLREEGARRLTRAKAQLETEMRARAQQQAVQAVREALPLLRQALDARWCEPETRRQWTSAIARLCADRLPPGAWCIEHPRDWTEAEQKQFAAAVGDGAQVNFQAGDIAAGLRISADQAVLDATPQGLLADATAIAALLLDEIGAAP
jgi:type II secretory pathway pseudopilin PulG